MRRDQSGRWSAPTTLSVLKLDSESGFNLHFYIISHFNDICYYDVIMMFYF